MKLSGLFRTLQLSILGAALSLPVVAEATVSVVATDRANRLVGVAAMSCSAALPVPGTCACDPSIDFECDATGIKDCGETGLNSLFVIVPDKGAMMSQFNALLDPCFLPMLDEARRGFVDGLHPQDNYTAVSDPTGVDSCVLLQLPTNRTRQQSYVNLHGQTAGGSCDFVVAPTRTRIFGAEGSTYGHRNGSVGPMVASASGEKSRRFTYAIAGNTLVDAENEIVDITESAFRRKSECQSDDLADRLYRALLAAQFNGGDARCNGSSEAVLKIVDRHGNILINEQVRLPEANNAVNVLGSQLFGNRLLCSGFEDDAPITEPAPVAQNVEHRCPGIVFDVTDGTSLDEDDNRSASFGDAATHEPDWWVPTETTTPATFEKDGLVVLDSSEGTPVAHLFLENRAEGLLPGIKNPRYLILVTNVDEDRHVRHMVHRPKLGLEKIELKMRRGWGTGLFKIEAFLIGRDRATGEGVVVTQFPEAFVEVQ